MDSGPELSPHPHDSSGVASGGRRSSLFCGVTVKTSLRGGPGRLAPATLAKTLAILQEMFAP